MPKKLKSIFPENANATMVKKAIIVAFLAVFVRSFMVKLAVMVMKIGMVPRGLISVKNEVKTNINAAKISAII
jgi:hypothetical protein